MAQYSLTSCKTGNLCLLILLLLITMPAQSLAQQAPDADLLSLFKEWRALDAATVVDGVPDYTPAAVKQRAAHLKKLQMQLAAIDTSGWQISQRVDYYLLFAEMNALDFYIRVLKPWQRDPAYYTSVYSYQSDTPAHEGPNHHALIELWMYEYPLSESAEKKLTAELQSVRPLLQQARSNLTGNARELWIGGIGNLRGQVSDLKQLAEKTKNAGGEYQSALKDAVAATESFISWLEDQSASKTGPSGIGKEAYTWHLRNVLLVPLSWEEEVTLLKRELARAHSSLRLETHRNRHLPELLQADSPEAYEKLASASVTKFIAFLRDQKIMPVRDYMDPALRPHMGRFVPEDRRNFFRRAMHYEPMTLYTHFYHWFDLARIRDNPHSNPMRKEALLYNVWMSRSEGHATGFEEMMMHAGLYDDNPRVREIVWIMLAQRAARGLGSLYAQANNSTLKEARDYHVKWTPRGWMREDLDLLGFEQLLYLRQPGYGTSYITGKYLVERLMTERSHQLGDQFTMSGFFEDMDATGMIPVSLIHWQLTGNDAMVRELQLED